MRWLMVLMTAWLLLSGLSSNACAATTAGPVEGLSAADWADITRQIEAPKYRVDETRAGYTAHNPEQGFDIRYRADGQTRLVARDAGAEKPFQIGLKLEALGYGEHLRVLGSPESIVAHGNTLTYQWHAGLREWWVNTPTASSKASNCARARRARRTGR